MNIDSINYTLILYTAFCILLGIFFCWFYQKKMISTQSQEIDALGESLNELLKKYDTIRTQLSAVIRFNLGLFLVVFSFNQACILQAFFQDHFTPVTLLL